MTQLVEVGIVLGAALFVVFLAALLTVAATVVLAGGAWAWAYAIASAHRARLHAIQAAVSEKTLKETDEALDETRERLNRRPLPTEGDIRRFIVEEEREATNGSVRDEYTTLGNEQVPETSPTAVGGVGDMYRTAPPGTVIETDEM